MVCTSDTVTAPVHPKGRRAKILLSSVFGPFACDDEFGSRPDNPMELYQNQVTRVQGAFSLRMFHRSFGLMLIKENVDAPATLLDFPSLERFTEELRTHQYDIVGIGGIATNIGKIKEMCRLTRLLQPQASIVIGGHITNVDGIEERIDADHIVRGDGVRWFRQFLGQDEDAPIKHPATISGFGSRIMGIDLADAPEDTAAILIPSVGCPVGCNFCSTSALFGGKGKFINFYETGDQLFEVMAGIEAKLGSSSFFILDENFLLHRKRALRLLDLMREHDKSWSLYIFSSARVLRQYSIEQLVALGVSWVWMGLEGEASRYSKLNGVDTVELVAELQDNGIKVLGSSIIGMENHSHENIDAVIDRAVAHNSVFHQFMLYTPNHGTPLHRELKEKGALLDESECPIADAHGQRRFSHRHPLITDGSEGRYLLAAFERDFQRNGPSIARLIRVTLNGHLRHGSHPDARVARRIARESRELGSKYAGVVWAIGRTFRRDPETAAAMKSLLDDIKSAFGWRARLAAPILGLYLAHTIRREERLLAGGHTYEPQTFYERPAVAAGLGSKSKPESAAAQAAIVQPGLAATGGA